ncbi:DNA-directed RNA polymerase specialized sigma subunit, sigma24 family [Frankineae bacterium MT45]|nr:DNA-directed RNA polymerase specialized sigma subunit, sigma24 family [Frankineae bacterium MT45]
MALSGGGRGSNSHAPDPDDDTRWLFADDSEPHLDVSFPTQAFTVAEPFDARPFDAGPSTAALPYAPSDYPTPANAADYPPAAYPLVDYAPAAYPPVDFAEAYTSHSLAIARLSVLLTDERAHAAQVTQAAFVALDLHLNEFGDLEDALGYLQRKVVEKARPQRRHERHPEPAGDVLIDALRRLPGEQREVIVLTRWARLTDAEAAELLDVPVEEVARLSDSARTALAAALQSVRPGPVGPASAGPGSAGPGSAGPGAVGPTSAGPTPAGPGSLVRDQA